MYCMCMRSPPPGTPPKFFINLYCRNGRIHDVVADELGRREPRGAVRRDGGAYGRELLRRGGACGSRTGRLRESVPDLLLDLLKPQSCSELPRRLRRRRRRRPRLHSHATATATATATCKSARLTCGCSFDMIPASDVAKRMSSNVFTSAPLSAQFTCSGNSECRAVCSRESKPDLRPALA